jgi:hypothetical protein
MLYDWYDIVMGFDVEGFDKCGIKFNVNVINWQINV